MITLVNYGLGNISAFANVYKRLNIPVRIATTADELAGAERIVLPGVGAFDHAMEQLDASGMREALDRKVVGEQTPVLGVCVGMQMMAVGSEEGSREGLGWVKAQVRRFKAEQGSNGPLRLPHMGWNDVRPAADQPLFAGLEEGARFYFLHSYYVECEAASDVSAMADYGGEFGCAVRSGNVHGVQFHPEKSHRFGVALLKNFAQI